MILQGRLFLWWSRIESPSLKSITLQMWSNDSTSQTNFSDHVIGTVTQIDEQLSPAEMETNFIKIPVTVNKLENGTIIELKFSGKVTGLLFPNPNRIVVRVVATMFDMIDGEPIEQDLRYLEWITFDGATRADHESLNFRAIDLEPRSVTIVWNDLAFADRKRCLQLCYMNDGQNIYPERSDSKRIECVNM